MILETRGMFLGNNSFLPDFTASSPVNCKKLLMSPKLIQFLNKQGRHSQTGF